MYSCRRMKYLQTPLLIAALLLAATLFAVSWIIWSLEPEELLVYATTTTWRYGTGYVIGPLARDRLRLMDRCPVLGHLAAGNNPIAFALASSQNPFWGNHDVAFEVATILIGKGCDINGYSHGRFTPLLASVLADDPKAVSFLLSHRANPQLPILALPAGEGRAMPTDGLDAYQLAVWMRDHSRSKPDMSAVLAELQTSEKAPGTGK